MNKYEERDITKQRLSLIEGGLNMSRLALMSIWIIEAGSNG